MIKYLFILLFCFSISKDIENRFNWKRNLIPTYGQFKNKKYIKGLTIGMSQVYATSKFVDYRNKNYIGKRNTYMWWMLGLYFYGIIDAYVDFNLKNFPNKNIEDN